MALLYTDARRVVFFESTGTVFGLTPLGTAEEGVGLVAILKRWSRIFLCAPGFRSD